MIVRSGAHAIPALAFCLLVGGSPVASALEFRHALDDSALDLAPLPGEVFTRGVREFHRTGVNPYNGQEQALAQGKSLYLDHCQVCHLPDGAGKLGPSLIGDKPIRRRAATDLGMFEVIHSGAAGAMGSFSKRGMTQDQILQVMAYVRSLKKK